MNTEEQNNLKIVLVTGSSHGIGFEVCRQLAKRGMTVILTARDLAKATRSAKQLIDEGLDVRFHSLDVTQDASVRELAQEMEREFGRIDVLITMRLRMSIGQRRLALLI